MRVKTTGKIGKTHKKASLSLGEKRHLSSLIYGVGSHSSVEDKAKITKKLDRFLEVDEE